MPFKLEIHSRGDFLYNGKIRLNYGKLKDKSTSGFIYVADIGNGLFKIGKTSDPEKRLRTFTASNPGVSFAVLTRVVDMHFAERALHYVFRRFNKERELFRLGPKQLKKAEKLLHGVSCQRIYTNPMFEKFLR